LKNISVFLQNVQELKIFYYHSNIHLQLLDDCMHVRILILTSLLITTMMSDVDKCQLQYITNKNVQQAHLN